MDLETVGNVSLHNGGGFVAKIQFKYYDGDDWKDSKKSGDITLGATEKADPGDYGVPNRSHIKLKAFVVAGKDNVAKRELIYDNRSDETAEYVITGTTLNNKLGLIGFIH